MGVSNILLILSSVFLNASAQILMRKGMLILGEVSISSLVKTLPQMITNVWLWLSLFCYGVSIITWMLVLSRVEVSFAYPFLGIAFVLVTILGYLLFKENLTFIRVIGIILICIGVFFISRS